MTLRHENWRGEVQEYQANIDRKQEKDLVANVPLQW